MSNDHVSNYLCIGCPLGCRLEVEDDNKGDVVEVRGFTCKKGKIYGEQEHTDPKRMVTTTVRVIGGRWDKLPVKTKAPIPKDLVLKICTQLREITMEAPVSMGNIICKNILDTGVDIVASRDMPVNS
ncbi:MAG: DUF1667 domain-containing protein [Rhodospirillales bacterium]|nr:DUF1667 domain-containing protein [Rhodospirillales bacterium]